ncbi:hypothetical protein CBL_09887 [Carabus blaptoides fortunei]
MQLSTWFLTHFVVSILSRVYLFAGYITYHCAYLSSEKYRIFENFIQIQNEISYISLN